MQEFCGGEEGREESAIDRYEGEPIVKHDKPQRVFVHATMLALLPIDKSNPSSGELGAALASIDSTNRMFNSSERQRAERAR